MAKILPLVKVYFKLSFAYSSNPTTYNFVIFSFFSFIVIQLILILISCWFYYDYFSSKRLFISWTI